MRPLVTSPKVPTQTVSQRAATRSLRPISWKQYLARGLLALGLIAVGFFGWTAFKLWASWQSVDRLAFDPEGSREQIAAQIDGEVALGVLDETSADGAAAPDVTLTPAVTSPDIEEGTFQAYLIVGSDARPPYEVSRADVILLGLFPPGKPPALVSLPRDLYVPNPCRGTSTRINATLLGCDEAASGAELLALAVEDFTGIAIDHFALFDFEGFREIIDSVGGVEICVDNRVFDRKAELDLPAGCSNAGGDQALAWVRSRHTRELVDGLWRDMPGVSDLTRNQHQQELLIQMIGKLQGFGSVGDLTDTVRSLANTFTIDEGLGLTDAVSLAWDLRGIDASDILRLSIPVRHYTTSTGAQVLLPTAPFINILTEAYPDLVNEALTGAR